MQEDAAVVQGEPEELLAQISPQHADAEAPYGSVDVEAPQARAAELVHPVVDFGEQACAEWVSDVYGHVLTRLREGCAGPSPSSSSAAALAATTARSVSTALWSVSGSALFAAARAAARMISSRSPAGQCSCVTCRSKTVDEAPSVPGVPGADVCSLRYQRER
jgi:hypothetical protein